jgi:phage-related protein
MITFNDINAKVWGLILESTEIEKPEPKTNYINIPYGDGSADLSEALGEIKYADRKMELKFKTLNKDTLETVMTSFAGAVHGKVATVAFAKDPGYYYRGRAAVSYSKGEVFGNVQVSLLCEPYKYKTQLTEQSESITTSAAVTLVNDRKTAYPRITTTAAMTIEKDGVIYSYDAVSDQQTAIPLYEGENELTITGTGDITFTWQEGAL